MDRQYLDVLTWLRGVAAFFVVVSHVLRTVEVSYLETDGISYFLPVNLLDLGAFGVTLFFALSGCTLYISNKNKVKSIDSFPSFLIKRTFRIWPAFFISLIVYLVFIELFRMSYSSDKSYWIAQFLKEYSFYDVISYLSLSFNINGNSGLFISPYWSLPVEYQYYLMLPIVMLLMRYLVVKNLDFIPPILVSIALYACYKFKFIEIERTEIFQLGYVFFGGVLAAKYYNFIRFKIPFWISVLILFSISIFLGSIKNDFIVIPPSVPFFSTKWNMFGMCSIFLVLIALITDLPFHKSKILEVLHRYGTISYSIYLTHMLFLGISTLAIIYSGIFDSATKLIFTFLFTVVGSYHFSKLSYLYIEKPTIDLGRRIALRFEKQDTVLAT